MGDPFSTPLHPLQPVLLTPLGLKNGQSQLRISGTVGPDYILQTSEGLTNWISLQTSSPAVMPFVFADPGSASLTNRLYRIRLGP